MTTFHLIFKVISGAINVIYEAHICRAKYLVL